VGERTKGTTRGGLEIQNSTDSSSLKGVRTARSGRGEAMEKLKRGRGLVGEEVGKKVG